MKKIFPITLLVTLLSLSGCVRGGSSTTIISPVPPSPSVNGSTSTLAPSTPVNPTTSVVAPSTSVAISSTKGPDSSTVNPSSSVVPPSTSVVTPSTTVVPPSSSTAASSSVSSTVVPTPEIKGSITVVTYGGDQESAYVEFDKVEGAESYNAYVSVAGQNSYTKLDDMLIREYSDYMRVDAVGLAKGVYDIKLVAVQSEQEVAASETVVSSLSVLAYDREGFGFVNGSSSGAYNLDGTLKANAKVVYVTNTNKNNVQCTIMTGSGKNETLTGFQNILLGLKKGYEPNPISIRLIGKIDDPEFMSDSGGDIVIDGNSKYSAGLTIEGIGNDAVAYGWGIRLKNSINVEIRNLAFMACDSKEGDCVGLQQNNNHIYVHNCDFFYGLAGGDADQAKGDGALDCKKSTFVTFSYNHYYDSGKCNLLGLSEGTTEGLYITYHHNWFDHSDSRHPRVRYYSAHVYNNYYDGNAKYGIGSTLGSSVFLEANYFRNCQYPMLISLQGSDMIGGTGTFSGEAGGIIKSYNNKMITPAAFVPYSDNNVEFDAYVAETRDEVVPATVTSKSGANTYNNFDTSDIMYDYNVETPDDAKNTVTRLAGRVQGGDFRWTFNNSVDDKSYGVNAELKAAVLGYTTKLVKVGTAEQGTTEDPVTPPDDPVVPPVTDGIVHIFAKDGTTSSYFTIVGNTSNSKGSITYNGESLGICLKIEGSTKIEFTIDKAMTLTIVGQAACLGKNIKVDGDKYPFVLKDEQYLCEVPLEAGTHAITKADSINIYVLILA